MDPLWCQLAACAVAAIYCLWRSHERRVAQRREILCDRVTFMLWVMAEPSGDAEIVLPS